MGCWIWHNFVSQFVTWRVVYHTLTNPTRHVANCSTKLCQI